MPSFRAVLSLSVLAALACGKVADGGLTDPEVRPNDGGAGRTTDEPVGCVPVNRGDECTSDIDCPADSACVAGTEPATYAESCSDGTRRGDAGAPLACRHGAHARPDGCVEERFIEECATDEECPAGASCVESGLWMPSIWVRCPDGSSSGSGDGRVVHECRVGADGGS